MQTPLQSQAQARPTTATATATATATSTQVDSAHGHGDDSTDAESSPMDSLLHSLGVSPAAAQKTTDSEQSMSASAPAAADRRPTTAGSTLGIVSSSEPQSPSPQSASASARRYFVFDRA